jgi:hypothetical protein
MRRTNLHAGTRAATKRGARRGFTLLETGMALVIIMVGVLAMVEAQRSFIFSNAWSSHEATATYLCNELRERMRVLPRHDPVSSLLIIDGQLVGLGREPGEVTVNDLDDIDDYHELVFGESGNFDGPIDAFGRVIPQINPDGTVRIDTSTGQPMPLIGWTQSVRVEKISPYNFSAPVAWEYEEPPSGTYRGRALDKFPLRVTVTALYQGAMDAVPRPVVSMSWIVPDNQ